MSNKLIDARILLVTNTRAQHQFASVYENSDEAMHTLIGNTDAKFC